MKEFLRKEGTKEIQDKLAKYINDLKEGTVMSITFKYNELGWNCSIDIHIQHQIICIKRCWLKGKRREGVEKAFLINEKD